MKYMGSKSRIAKYIVPIIQKCIDSSETGFYYEPFCGGCNVIDKIIAKKRFASDKQQYLIELLSNLDKLECLPAHVSKELYADVRSSYYARDKRYDDWFIGAIGVLASYNGRFFDGGYAGVIKTKEGNIRDYYNESKQNMLRQRTLLTNVDFTWCDYDEIHPVCGSVIYCDPPYYNTKQYGVSKNFDYSGFWNWVDGICKTNIVLVSEQTAPERFSCVWEYPVLRSVDNSKRVSAIEKLFVSESQEQWVRRILEDGE